MITNSELFGRIDELETLVMAQPIPWAVKVTLTEWLDGFRDRVKQDESEQ